MFTLLTTHILARLKAKSLTQEDFAKLVGVSTRTMSTILNTGEVKKQATLDRMAEVLELPKEELIKSGETDTLPDYDYNVRRHEMGDKNNMWIVPVSAQAGFIKGFVNRHFSHQIRRISFPLIAGECFMFEVEGYSMFTMKDSEGSYTDGSFVICTLNEDIENLRIGSVYIFQTADGLCLKIFIGFEKGEVRLKSLNPTYNPTPPIAMEDLQQVYNIELKMSRAKINWVNYVSDMN